jgi:uncharacterized ion transporter superfamily protein YfcC
MNEELKAAAQQVRETAKWLIGAVAAIAGILVAGLSFTNIVQAESGYLWRVLLCVVLTLAGVLLALWFTTRVLIPESLDFQKLNTKRFAKVRHYIDKIPDLFPPPFTTTMQQSRLTFNATLMPGMKYSLTLLSNG